MSNAGLVGSVGVGFDWQSDLPHDPMSSVPIVMPVNDFSWNLGVEDAAQCSSGLIQAVGEEPLNIPEIPLPLSSFSTLEKTIWFLQSESTRAQHVLRHHYFPPHLPSIS